MDWAAPLGTAIGAVARISAAVVVERARWSLGRDDRRNDQRKAAYAAFLGALARAVEQIYSAARQQQGDRRQVALSALRDHSVQETRFELALSAPADVVGQAEVVAAKLVSLREAVADGASWDGEAYKNAWDEYYRGREEMIGYMRSSLGVHD